MRAWGADGRHIAVAAVYQAAQVMDHPADLINVAIEELVRQRFELAGFSTLDRLASRVRVLVHRRLFRLSSGVCLTRIAADSTRCWTATHRDGVHSTI